MTAVTALARDFDGDAVGRRHHRAGVGAHQARTHRRPVVHGIDSLDREAIEQPVFDHGARAGIALFTRLKNQDRSALKLARLRQVAGSAHQHRGVAVMAATMHQAGVGRPPRLLAGFSHRQCVHVRTQTDLAGARLTAVDHADHAGLADTSVHLIDTAQSQRLRHTARGVHLLETQFGMGVQVAAQGSELRMELRDMGEGTPTGLQPRGYSGCKHRINAPRPVPRAGADRRRNTTSRRSG